MELTWLEVASSMKEFSPDQMVLTDRFHGNTNGMRNNQPIDHWSRSHVTYLVQNFAIKEERLDPYNFQECP